MISDAPVKGADRIGEAVSSPPAISAGLETAPPFFYTFLSGKLPKIYYENNLYILFSLVGVDTNTEWYTSDGRIDVLVRVPRFIYLLELRLDRPVTEALEQIERKDYARQFESDGRPVIKIGIEFSTRTRNILSWRLFS